MIFLYVVLIYSRYLRHENIISFVGVTLVEDPKTKRVEEISVITELMEMNLNEAIHGEILNSTQKKIFVLKEIAKGMEHIHKFDYIHRDLKPSNVLLSQEGDKLIVKICE